MERDEKLLRYLELVSKRVRHHHDALWEEEKHYSWWLYPILAGLVYVIIKDNISPWIEFVIVIGGGIIGLYLSIAAIKVIRRESLFFWRALQTSRNLVAALKINEVKLENGNPILPEDDTEYETFANLEAKARPPLGGVFGAFFRNNTGIRAVFQVTFIVTAAAFIGLMAFEGHIFCLWMVRQLIDCYQ